MTDLSADSIVRPLGFVEAGFHLLNSRFAATTQGLAAVLFEGELEAVALERSLVTLRRSWPALRAIVMDSQERPYLGLLPNDAEMPYSAVDCASKVDWLTFYQHELDSPIDLSLGPWRALYLAHVRGRHRHVLLLSVCHVVFDANAIAEFARAILLHAAHAHEPKAAVFPSPAEVAVAATTSYQQYMTNRRWEADQGRSIAKTRYGSIVDLSRRRTRFVLRSYDKALNGPVFDALNAQRVSMYSAASAAAMRAVCSATPGKSGAIVNTAFSLRGLASKRSADESLGCYLSIMGTAHTNVLEHDSAWSLATEHRDRFLATSLRLCPLPDNYSYSALLQQSDALVGLDAFINDLAVIYVRPQLDLGRGPLRVAEYYVSARRHVGNVSTAWHLFDLPERICLVLNYVEPLVHADWAIECVYKFERELQLIG